MLVCAVSLGWDHGSSVDTRRDCVQARVSDRNSSTRQLSVVFCTVEALLGITGLYKNGDDGNEQKHGTQGSDGDGWMCCQPQPSIGIDGSLRSTMRTRSIQLAC